jgi:hypothetical protein
LALVTIEAKLVKQQFDLRSYFVFPDLPTQEECPKLWVATTIGEVVVVAVADGGAVSNQAPSLYIQDFVLNLESSAVHSVKETINASYKTEIYFFASHFQLSRMECLGAINFNPDKRI